jgi:tetratricopeptide (TPR) repeat protein
MEKVFFFDRVNKVCLILALFLVPLLFLPFAQDVLDFPKQFLLSFLIFLSLIAWLAKQIFQKKIILRQNKLFFVSFALIFLSFLFSTIFSLWPEASFWGWTGSISDNLLSIILFLVLAFLVGNSFEEEKDFLPIFLFLLVSGALIGILNLLQIYGLFALPFDFAQIPSFSLVGTVYAFAVFSAILLPISLILVFKTQNLWRIIFSIISLVFLANLILVDFRGAWIGLLFAVLFLFIFGLATGRKIKLSWLGSLMLLLVLTIFFIFFSFPGFPDLPIEVSPSFNSEIQILKGTFSEGFKNIILGTGPGSFIFDYSRFRSPLLNQTLFWGTRFSVGNSSFLDWIVTKGILGMISLSLLFLTAIYFGIKNLRKAPNEIKLGISASILAMLAVSFIYSLNFTLWFLFLFLIGALLFFNSKPVQIDLHPSSSQLLLTGLIFIAVMISGLILLIFEGRAYFAGVEYSKGMGAFQRGENNLAIVSLQRAVTLNPSVDFYWRDLAQLYLAQANTISQDPELSSEEKRQLTQQAVANGIDALNQTIDIAPFNVANWNVRGFFYRNLIGISGAGELALESYRKAITLEPASPFGNGEMGRVYVLMAQDFVNKANKEAAEEALSLALKNLNESLDLKSDYAPAHYLLAVVYDQQGKENEAIEKLEELKLITPNDAGITFQLGVLYWRREELNKAQVEFTKAINLNPDYSNARYMLGLVYDKLGEKEKAKEQFEKVTQLNPENQEVKKILENLNEGLPALEGIIPAQPPIAEIPPEIQK